MMRRWLGTAVARTSKSRRWLSVGAQEVAIKVQGAPLSASMAEAYGVVAEVGSSVSSIAVNDTVFVTTATQIESLAYAEKDSVFADEALLVSPANNVVKLPGETPPNVAASLKSACAAYELLRDVTAGDVVVHYGGESAVGQCVAQLSEQRGAKLVALVSSEVVEFDETVNLLKNLGALVAAPADYALRPGFRAIVHDLGPPSLVIVDSAYVDTANVNVLLEAAKSATTSATRKAFTSLGINLVDSTNKADIRDARVLSTVLGLAKAGAKLLTFDSHLKAIAPLQCGFTPFDLDAPVMNATTVADVTNAAINDRLTVFAEAYDEGS